jgi:purine nucleosidase
MNPILLLSIVAAAGLAATGISSSAAASPEKIRVILDTDANNELDDQHAIAYLLFNGDVFDVEAITVNRTQAGGGVDQHLAEALRVVRLCGLEGQIPVLLGADKSFEEIRGQLDKPEFDGVEAVNFIIERAKATDGRRLVLLPVGKLTNIALALEKDPSIIPNVRVVWLGSNYPKRGEYNKENDVESLNYILETEVEFEIATVRYGAPSGTDAVRATLDEIRKIMPGKGPKIDPPVTGRHGGQFSNFGDYSINLFENIRLHGDPPSRALFDMAAVAIVKNPAWATAVEMPAPTLREGQWRERPDNPRKIILWENFDRKAIMTDFYDRMENYQLARLPRDVGRIQPWFQDRRESAAGRPPDRDRGAGQRTLVGAHCGPLES